jgi:hypothetical protein
VALNGQGLYIFLWTGKWGSSVKGRSFLVHKRIVSTVRMSHTILRGRWCNIIVSNVHTPCEDKDDDVKDSLYEKLGRVLISFLGMI